MERNKDTFISCEAFTINHELKHSEDCHFGYRESIFKKKVKDQYIITSVVFKLTKRYHKINTSYGDITNELAKKHYKSKFERRKQLFIAIRQTNYRPKELETVVAFLKSIL
jgi:UDP-N-acetylmuramate dehydrogenase